jgi:hypothetical protein
LKLRRPRVSKRRQPAAQAVIHVVYNHRLTSVSTSSVKSLRGPLANSMPVRIT